MANINVKVIQDALARVYEALGFTGEEIKNVAQNLAGIQQLAAATELLRSLTGDEVKSLNEALKKTDGEKKIAMEKIAMAHSGDDDFKSRVQAAVKKAFDEHIADLKTRGDSNQKAKVAEILAGVE